MVYRENEKEMLVLIFKGQLGSIGVKLGANIRVEEEIRRLYAPKFAKSHD